jgi:hypothetical protein
MKINVTEIKTGDYIQDVGVVRNMKTFSSQVARGMSIVNDPTSSAEKELRECYKPCVDRVVVCGSNRDKSFYVDAEVEVIRSAA